MMVLRVPPGRHAVPPERRTGPRRLREIPRRLREAPDLLRGVPDLLRGVADLLREVPGRLRDVPPWLRTVPGRIRWRVVLLVLRGLAAVGIPTALFCWHASAYGRWEVDDAGITFAYARSVASGLGPVLQPGQPPVEGYSDPAWLGLLVVGHRLGLFDHGTWFGVPDYVAYPKVLGLLCVAAMFGAFLSAASAVSRFPAAVTLVAGCACAAVPSLVVWCVSGLENGLLAASVAGIAAVLVRAGDRLATWPSALACGLLAALAALTRPEGAIYAAAFPLALLLTGSGAPAVPWPARLLRPALACAVAVAAFLLPYGGYLLWRHAEFGAWLPTTAVAKSQGLPTVAGFAKVTQLVAYAGWAPTLLAALLIGAGLARRSPGVARALVPLALAVASFGVLVPDWMDQYRFATPVWALTPFVVALAAADVLPALGLRGRTAVGVGAAAAAVISGPAFVTDAETFAAVPTAPMCLIVTNTGREFNGYLDILGRRSGTFFAPEIGGAALTGRARLYDGGGLAEPTIAAFWARKDPAGIRDYVLDVVKPTFIRAHGSFRPFMGFDADPRFQRDYVEIDAIPNGGANWVRRDAVPDAATMARLEAWGRLALLADTAQRYTPLASCGPRLLVGPTTA